ncbi:hypothetical protein [uncultured Tateyamaria sp.]|uniref:hypothetical protein n=1 Tax=Tateyamaria sp. 1078 TaxID=3417464 RepID=UPI00262DE466|nr:hypothetical protein [uncultured Tateyamaria sp.]
MNDYRPTLDDIETLVTNQPDKFSSALQTRRSIANARRQGPVVEDITAQAQYGDYISKGGTPIGPNGEMPSTAPAASDQEFGGACAVCAAAGGCCIKGITFHCAHAQNRMTLPLKDDSKDRVLAVVCDKETNPTVDTVTIEVTHEPNANCCMTGQVPTLKLNSTPPVAENGIKLETKLQYDFAGESMSGTDLELFMKCTGKSIWSGVNSLGRDNSFEVCACGGGAQWGAIVRTFPKLEWEASAFEFGLEGTYDSSFNFESKFTFAGSLKGTYGASEFEISAGSETDPTQQSKSAVPFLDAAMQRLKSRAGNSGATPDRSIRSEIKTEHKMIMSKATLKLAERGDDHSKVGVAADITMGFQPLIGITAKFEVIDMLLTAAQAHPSVPRKFVEAVKDARDWMARKPDESAAVYLMASAVCDLEFFAKTSVGRDISSDADTWAKTEDVTLKRAISSDTWDVTGSASTEIGVKLTLNLNVKGKAWIVEATFSASGEASSSVKGTLSGLSREEKQANPEAKLNVLVDWSGVAIEVKAAYEMGTSNHKVGSSASQKIPIFEAVELYKGTM